MISPLIQFLRATRPPAWAIRFLPGNSSQFGPPRRMASAAELDLPLRLAGNIPTVNFAEPNLLNAPDPYWSTAPKLSSPQQPFVFTTEWGRLLHPGSWVVVSPDTFVTDTAFWGHADLATARRWHAIFRRKRVFPGKQLAGHVLSLASDFAPWSFGHWLIDSLPRWKLALRAGLDLDTFNHIYLPSPDTPSTRLLISRLNVQSNRLLTTPPATDLHTELLTATSFPSSPGAACSLARECATELNPPGKHFRRLFLSRIGHRRNFADPEGVWKVLQRNGFEFCDPATDPEALAKCAEASVVFGIEGSQMFNALFAPSGGKMIVVGPDGFHPLPYMQSIAGAADLSLAIIGARTVGPGFNCEIPPTKLDTCLKEILS